MLADPMADILKFIHLRFKTPPLHRMIIEHEVRQANITGSLTIAGLCIPFSIITYLYFTFYFVADNSIEQIWAGRLLSLDIYIGIICVAMFSTGVYLKYKKKTGGLFNILLPHLIFLVCGFWGMICSVHNQTVAGTILPFLLVCLLNVTVLLIRPLNLLVYLVVLYTCFAYGIDYIQPIPGSIFLPKLDALAIVAISFGIGCVLWKHRMTRFRQDRLIKSQRLELEHQYDKLLKSSQDLEKSNASKDKFFSILAHDLRGPITSTLALTGLLMEGMFDEDLEERQKMYVLLQNSLDNSWKLLENVLLWSRNQAGILTFQPTPLNVHDTVESSIEVLKIVAEHKNIKIRNFVNKEISISADVDMVNTILRNLLSNAIKFTADGGTVELNAEMLTNAISGNKSVSISVTDYGIGMNTNTLNNLFRIEHKMIGRGTNNETGTGLGLVLCKDFIEKHKGSIIVESNENEGSKFIITLPERH